MNDNKSHSLIFITLYKKIFKKDSINWLAIQIADSKKILVMLF